MRFSKKRQRAEDHASGDNISAPPSRCKKLKTHHRGRDKSQAIDVACELANQACRKASSNHTGTHGARFRQIASTVRVPVKFDVQKSTLSISKPDKAAWSGDESIRVDEFEPCRTPSLVIKRTEPASIVATCNSLDDSDRSAYVDWKPVSERVWAVRVGWIPGIYNEHAKAKAQTYRYPNNELRRFESAKAAETWLACLDRTSVSRRPAASVSGIDVLGFAEYLQRTWDTRNAEDDISEKEDIFPKLREIFETAVGSQVDWATYPSPQELIRKERHKEERTAVSFPSAELQQLQEDFDSTVLSPTISNDHAMSSEIYYSNAIPYFDEDDFSSTLSLTDVGENSKSTASKSCANQKSPCAQPSSVQNPRMLSTMLWKADPTRLSSGKKAKYYGVRVGHKPGIYYSWDDVEKQVTGFRDAVHQSFRTKDEIEDYMNHAPAFCQYNSCTSRCKAAGRANSEIAPSDNNPVQPQYACECCGNLKEAPAPLCGNCFAHPTAWLDCVIQNHSLVQEQSTILRSVANRRNVFFTGAAGTGKSTVIRAIQDYLRGLERGVETVAYMGIAALNVKGQTLHKYASWNGNSDRISLEELCTKNAHNTKFWQQVDRTDVLIIDEISMIESNTITRLSRMMQASVTSASRNKDKQAPFGGVQIIVTGDFYQLPPVLPFHCCLYCGQELEGWEERQPTYVCKDHGEFADDDKWAFCSKVWHACDFHSIELKQVHRQRDPVFQKILEYLRKGIPWTAEEEKILLGHKHNVEWDEATKILPKRVDVEIVNSGHMKEIKAAPLTYTSVDNFQWDHYRHPELEYCTIRVDGPQSSLKVLAPHRYHDELELKIGMFVILLVNLDEHLVNGSTGRIVEFVDMDGNMPRAPRNLKDQAEYRGQFLFGAHRHYQESRIHDFRHRTRESYRKWPVVEFKNGERRIIYANCLVQERGRKKPYSLLSRTQIPLVAGWAITVHKSQGMTLDRVIVNLDSSFELGQAYVALSRVRSLDGLIVQSLPKPKQIGANPVVERFMERNFGEDEECVSIKLEE